jgi:hypothetical protein
MSSSLCQSSFGFSRLPQCRPAKENLNEDAGTGLETVLMAKSDEKALMAELRKRTADGEQPYVRDLVKDLGIPEKRAAFIVQKWESRGWYEFGVNCLAGWLTDQGRYVDLV